MKKELFNSFSFTALSSGLFFVFNFFIAKMLGANEYGQIVYYLSFINIFALIISLNYSALYMGNRIIDNDSNTFSLFISWQSLFFVIAFIPAFLMLSYFFSSVREIIAIALIAYLLTVVSTIGLEFNAKKEVAKSILISVLIPRVLLIFIFINLFIFGIANSQNYLYVYSVVLLLVALYFTLQLKPKIYLKKEILSRAWKFYLLGVIGSSFTYLAQILQKKYGNYEILATLAIVLLIFAGLSLVGTVLVKFVLPKIHEYYREQNIKAIGKLYSNNTKIVLMVVVPLLTFFYFNLDLATKMLGDGYSHLPMMFSILLIGYTADLLTGITGYLLRATKNEKYEIYNEIIRLVVGLGLIYALKENQYGVAIAITISMLIYNILKFLEVYYLFKFIPLNLKEMTSALVLVGILIILFFGISKIDMINLRVILNIVLLVASYTIVFNYIKRDKNLLKGYR
ncbi:MAG: hypothetical protein LGB62_00350 [Sulfurovum sp.]|nr:hypothetical protein [Sulfurovum sp.]MCB4779665.1 hypothetical protein [Sulfurovum sp.]